MEGVGEEMGIYVYTDESLKNKEKSKDNVF